MLRDARRGRERQDVTGVPAGNPGATAPAAPPCEGSEEGRSRQPPSSRNLSKYDRSVLALELEPLYAAEAKRKMSPGTNQYTRSSQKSDETSHIRTDEQLAKLAGTSRDTIRKVKVIETEAAKGNETAIEAREAVKSGEGQPPKESASPRDRA